MAKTDEKKILQSLFKEADRLNRLRQPTTSFFTNADIKKILNYITKYHDGNLSAAAADLGVTRVRVKGLLDRRGIKLDRAGNKLISKLKLPEGTGTYPDLTTKLKKDPSFLRDRITQLVKKRKIKPNAKYNVADLGKILNIDVSDKQVRSFLTGDLKKLGVSSSTSGKEKIRNYKLSDVVNKLIEKSKTKKVKGEAIADTERLKIISKKDPELNKFITNTNTRLRNIANETGLASPDLFNKSKVEDVGHAMSVKITDKDKFKNLFKNSNINKINTLVFQDPEVNRVVLNKTGYEAGHERLFNELNTVLNKKITPLDELKLKRIKKELNELHLKARKDIKNLATTNKYFIGQENRLPKIDINIPRIGETFKSSDLFADMSGVDEAYRVGQVHKINPNAQFLKDLNANELGMFQETFVNQTADNVEKFFTKAKFPIENIKEFREGVEIGTDSRLPVLAIQKYNKASKTGKEFMEEAIGCAKGCFVKAVNEEPGKAVRALNAIKNFLVPKPEMPSIKYDDTLGAFVNTGTDDVVSQAGLKAWAADNPMPVQAGTSVKPGLLRKTGRALAHVGLPLPTAALDTYFIGRQIEEGRDPVDIAKDPFNWLGLATMEPLTKAAGVADKSGKLASVARLGMSPGMIRGATRFLGLPGLAISTGLTAYDQYKKYQDKEGFICDLFNKVDKTDV